MVKQGCYDGLEHGLLHPCGHGPDAVHDNVQETDVEIWSVKVGTILIWVNLEMEIVS